MVCLSYREGYLLLLYPGWLRPSRQIVHDFLRFRCSFTDRYEKQPWQHVGRGKTFGIRKNSTPKDGQRESVDKHPQLKSLPSPNLVKFEKKMFLTMRVLVLVALCLCFAAPSPVLSITMPEGDFPETQMAGVADGASEEKNFNTIAKSLIRKVLDAAEEGQVVNEDEVDGEGEIPLTKRAGSSRQERELRRSFPLGRRWGDQIGSRSNPPVLTSRSKFTFGKRDPMQAAYSRPTAKQLLLEELEKEAYLRNQDDLAFLNDADLYNIPEDNHQVQKDAYSAFSFGKRGMPAFSFGKRGMPSFAFGKRGYSSFAFGKRGLNGPAFAFGRRQWVPTEQELDAPETGPYEIKRNVAFAFGKRDDQ